MKTNYKVLAAASYLPPLFALFLFFRGDNPHIFFHARQALWVWLFFIAALAVAILPGQFLALFKWPISITLALLFIYLFINGIVDALRGKDVPLPPLGDFVQGRLFESLRKH